MSMENGGKIGILDKNLYEKVCRLCLNKSPIISIFEIYFNDKLLVEPLQELTSIEVNKNDELPKNVCEACIGQIVGYQTFKETCINSFKILTASITFEADRNKIVNNETKVIAVKEEEKQPSSPLNLRYENIEIDDIQFDIEPGNWQQEEEQSIENVIEETLNNNKSIIEATEEPILSNQTPNGARSTLKVEDPEAAVANLKYYDLGQDSDENDDDWLYDPAEPEGLKTESFDGLDIYHCPCPQTFGSLSDFLNHTEEVEHSVSCYLCNETFLDLKKLKQHLIVSHIFVSERFSCIFCSMTFCSSTSRNRHAQIHTGVKPHVCEFCGKSFIQGPSLAVHRRRHTGERPFMCEFCGKRMISNEALRGHSCSKTLHTRKYGLGSRQCLSCNLEFATRVQLFRHNDEFHRSERQLCQTCGKTFANKLSLFYHSKTHLKLKERTTVCSYCGKTFAHAIGLKTHLRIHTGEKPYKCSVCPKRYTQLSHLSTHTKTHTGEKPHVCPYCSRPFALRGNLTVHMRTHTGETPYMCCFCPSGFYDSSSLKRHKLRHHLFK